MQSPLHRQQIGVLRGDAIADKVRIDLRGHGGSGQGWFRGFSSGFSQPRRCRFRGGPYAPSV